MDEAFHIPWENGKSISHFCKRPVRTVIECTTKEPLKNWNLRTRMIFSESGSMHYFPSEMIKNRDKYKWVYSRKE